MIFRLPPSSSPFVRPPPAPPFLLIISTYVHSFSHHLSSSIFFAFTPTPHRNFTRHLRQQRAYNFPFTLLHSAYLSAPTMLTRQPTLIWEPVKPQSPKPHISYMDKRHLIPSPPPSAGASSVASSYSDEDEYDAIARAPNLFLYVSRQHYETWDAKPG